MHSNLECSQDLKRHRSVEVSRNESEFLRDIENESYREALREIFKVLPWSGTQIWVGRKKEHLFGF